MKNIALVLEPLTIFALSLNTENQPDDSRLNRPEYKGEGHACGQFR